MSGQGRTRRWRVSAVGSPGAGYLFGGPPKNACEPHALPVGISGDINAERAEALSTTEDF